MWVLEITKCNNMVNSYLCGANKNLKNKVKIIYDYVVFIFYISSVSCVSERK